MTFTAKPGWLSVKRGSTALIVSLPHTGTDIAPEIRRRLVSSWRARKDTDWHIDTLYDFAAGLGATIIHTAISRSMIDVNRDPSGLPLYPGQVTTELCPTTTFDGEPLYKPGKEPDADEIVERKTAFFAPYHAAIRNEIERVKALHGRVILYDCHSIRSIIPRLFEGELPQFNIGTNSGAACDPALATRIFGACRGGGYSAVVNGRFKGGYITRYYGRPAEGVHALQMELACRLYMPDPPGPVSRAVWPARYSADYAAPMRTKLTAILRICTDYGAKR